MTEGFNVNSKDDGFRSTISNSFFKTNRSTAMSDTSFKPYYGSKDSGDDNAASDLVSNTD